MTKAWWAALGIVLIAGGAAVAWFMLRAAMSQRVSDHLYRQDSWFRSRLHVKPKDPAIYRRGLKLGFGFAGLWGVAAVCVGVAIIATNVF